MQSLVIYFAEGRTSDALMEQKLQKSRNFPHARCLHHAGRSRTIESVRSGGCRAQHQRRCRLQQQAERMGLVCSRSTRDIQVLREGVVFDVRDLKLPGGYCFGWNHSNFETARSRPRRRRDEDVTATAALLTVRLQVWG